MHIKLRKSEFDKKLCMFSVTFHTFGVELPRDEVINKLSKHVAAFQRHID